MTPDWTVSCSMPVNWLPMIFFPKRNDVPRNILNWLFFFFNSEVRKNPWWKNELRVFINFGGKLIISWQKEDAALEKTSFLWEQLFLPWVRTKCVPKKDYWRQIIRLTELITLVLFTTTYLTNEPHTHTHTHTHLLTLCPVQTKPAFTDTRWCSQTEAAGHRWRQRLGWRFHTGDFLFSPHRSFCSYFFSTAV